MTAWTFHEAENKIIRGNEVAQLTPKASAVLSCLLRHSGQVVPKETILAEVWAGLNVTEALIREYVFDIRAALGDDARKPRYIETVRGKGFRLIGNIDRASEDDPSPAGTLKPIIAVLPIDSDVKDSQTAAACERLAETIIAGLAGHRDVEVVSRRSTLAIDPNCDIREAARRLSADYLVEGRVDFAVPNISGFFHLIDGKTGRHVWAQRMDVPETETLSDFDALANKVVNALAGWQGELHLAELRTASRKSLVQLNAFEHFIRGCDLELNFDVNSVRRSLDHLDRSLALDPDFARCWVVKAIMLQWYYDMFAKKDEGLLLQSQQAMARAILLDPRDPLTRSLMALQCAREGDMAGAKEAMERAAPACAADADASVCLATALCVLSGDYSRSKAMFEQGVALNPVYPGWYRFVEARICFYFEEYERSIAASRSGPQRVSAMLYRCLSRIMLGQVEAARTDYVDLLERYPSFDFTFYADYFPIADPAARRQYETATRRLVASGPLPN